MCEYNNVIMYSPFKQATWILQFHLEAIYLLWGFTVHLSANFRYMRLSVKKYKNDGILIN